MLQQIMSVCATVASFSIVLIVFIVWAMILWAIARGIFNMIISLWLYIRIALKLKKERTK